VRAHFFQRGIQFGLYDDLAPVQRKSARRPGIIDRRSRAELHLHCLTECLRFPSGFDWRKSWRRFTYSASASARQSRLFVMRFLPIERDNSSNIQYEGRSQHMMEGQHQRCFSASHFNRLA